MAAPGAPGRTGPARRRVLFHPILFGLFPALSLAAQNVSQIEGEDIWWACALSVVGALALLLLAQLVLRDWRKSALVASFGTLLFFSYGHIYGWLNEKAGIRHRLLLSAVIAVFLAACWAIGRWRRNLAPLNRSLNWIALLLVVTPTARVAAYRIDAAFRSRANLRQVSGVSTIARGATLPDVYYVILDGYSSAATLKAIYGYDNGPFVDYLRSRGFYVADGSHSNYSMTTLSLASSTNMEYLDEMAKALGPETRDMGPIRDLIKNNRVLQTFKRRGYKFVNFQSGWTVTPKNENADWDVNCGGSREFSRVLAQTTLLQPFGISHRIAEESRRRILCEFSTLQEVQHRIPPPRFVFAHIVSPHPPFLFGRHGERIDNETEDLGELQWKDKSGYIDQLVFCNQRVQETVDRILREARTPPIIIIQGDHGSASSGYDEASDTLFRERMGILNAYLLPRGPSSLYPSISPVNSFRVVLNDYFGEPHALLDDRSFFSQYAHPYVMEDITAKVTWR